MVEEGPHYSKRGIGFTSHQGSTESYVKTLECLVTNDKSIKYPRIFDFDVIKRILAALDEKGSSKITNLAMFSRVNYSTCKRYLHLLKAIGWIEIVHSDKSTIINLTEVGRTAYISLRRLT